MRGLAILTLMFVALVALFAVPFFAGRAFALGEESLSPQSVEALLVEGKITLVDVREKNEFDLEHIAGAVLMPLSSFDVSKLPEVSAGKPIVFYCRSGHRSGIALQQAVAAGVAESMSVAADASLPKLAHMAGGINAWKAQRLAHLEKTEGLTECLLCKKKREGQE